MLVHLIIISQHELGLLGMFPYREGSRAREERITKDIMESLMLTNPESNLEWSPDGAHIVFTIRPKIQSSIYVAAADGSSVKPIREIEEGDWKSHVLPDISPDGSRVAYATHDYYLLERTFEPNFTIETSALDGSDRRRLTVDGEHLNTSPVWSPDGSRIAFAKNIGGVTGIYTIAPD